MINEIKFNVNVDRFALNELIAAGDFSNLAWKLLGRYIANNTQLKIIGLNNCRISDERMALLFSELVGSKSLDSVDLNNNEFGIEGVRSMAPFLQNSPQLKELYFCRNNGFDSECFEFLVRKLCGTGVKHLSFGDCNINNISSLSTVKLSNLQKLNLSGNKIGREGCITLSNLLQQELGSTLIHLYLSSTGMGDEEAELLATSLKHNTKLQFLYMTNNFNIAERGVRALLKLLVDVSSIQNTYNSNHTLTKLLVAYNPNDGMKRQINSAIQINKQSLNSEATGRAKVIKYQLNSRNRKNLCQLQGVEYSSIGNLFADIDPLLLPNILALIGREHGHSEFYTSFIPMVPDLMSYIDRRALIDDAITEVEATLAELTKKRDELHKRRACMESKADTQGNHEGEQKVTSCGGKKRRI